MGVENGWEKGSPKKMSLQNREKSWSAIFSYGLKCFTNSIPILFKNVDFFFFFADISGLEVCKPVLLSPKAGSYSSPSRFVPQNASCFYRKPSVTGSGQKWKKGRHRLPIEEWICHVKRNMCGAQGGQVIVVSRVETFFRADEDEKIQSQGLLRRLCKRERYTPQTRGRWPRHV